MPAGERRAVRPGFDVLDPGRQRFVVITVVRQVEADADRGSRFADLVASHDWLLIRRLLRRLLGGIAQAVPARARLGRRQDGAARERQGGGDGEQIEAGEASAAAHVRLHVRVRVGGTLER